ncbi:MAG TPA: spondin domain-containing protein [Gammaproteobacteria bacterium]|nr:spondin domain-containing protein [Gammaproteobacteria bacterium]
MRKLILAAALAAAAGPAGAADLTVKLTNLTQGIYFTPFLVAAHGGSTDLFEPGQAASQSLKQVAECGDLSGVEADLTAAGADLAKDPAGGTLAPGASATATITSGSGNDRLSLVAMMLPTNDGFVGLDSQAVPASKGTYTYYLNGWDAGSEANNELLATGGCSVGVAGIPADPGGAAGSGGSGVTTAENNTMIHIHRGNLGDTNASGGPSDLDSTLHRWQNPVLRVDVTVQ